MTHYDDPTEVEKAKVWLRNAGLGKYIDTLMENDFTTLDAISMISTEDLVAMGITAIGARRKFLSALNVLNAQSIEDSSPPGNRMAKSPPTPEADYTFKRLDHSPPARPQSNASYQQDSLSMLKSPNNNNNDGITLTSMVVSELQLLKEQQRKQEQEMAELRRRDAEKEELIRTLKRQNAAPNTFDVAVASAVVVDENDFKPRSLKLGPRGIADTEISQNLIETSEGFNSSNNANDSFAITPSTVAPVIAQLDRETRDLEAIAEAAHQLLDIEKQDAPRKVGEVVLRRRSMEVDVEYFRAKMMGRIQEWNSPAPKRSQSANKRLKMKTIKKADYAALLKEQEKQIRALDITNILYHRLVDLCLQKTRLERDGHAQVGEYRDKTEYQLKIRLSKLIGMMEPDERNELHESLSMTQNWDSPRHRKYSAFVTEQIQKELESILNAADENNDGLITSQELAAAVERQPSLKERLNVLAVNLAFQPENRFLGDNGTENEIQERLDSIANNIDKNHDGYFSAEELKTMSPSAKNSLEKIGIHVHI